MPSGRALLGRVVLAVEEGAAVGTAVGRTEVRMALGS